MSTTLWRYLPCEECGDIYEILDLIKTGRIDGKIRRYCAACWKPLEKRLRIDESGFYFIDPPPIKTEEHIT